MKIAIIGAGFCGLATAWHILNQAPSHTSPQISLFDSQGIGAGASGIAAGLLHPYAGAHSKLNRLGQEGLQATQELLQVASQALQKNVFSNKKILRLALTPDQQIDFSLAAAKYPKDIEWFDSDTCHEIYPFLAQAPGIWIKHGIVVNSPLYLEGLWKACFNLGATLEKQTIQTLEELKGFDAIVIAAGISCMQFPKLASFHLSAVKGQVLQIAWPKELPPISFALNSQAYLLMNEDQSSCLVGATFEKKYTDFKPDLEAAKFEILPKLTAMLPSMKDAKILSCQANGRVVTRNHLPLVEKIGSNQWVITGMGSKGLLYHALFAKQLACLITKELEK